MTWLKSFYTSIQYYVLLFLVGMVITLSLAYYIQSKDLDIARLEKAQFEEGLEIQNTILLAQQADYEKKLKQLPKQIEVITTKFKNIYTYIDSWKGDDNASDCNNSYKYLSTTKY